MIHIVLNQIRHAVQIIIDRNFYTMTMRKKFVKSCLRGIPAAILGSFLLEAGAGKMVRSRSTHPQVTQADG